MIPGDTKFDKCMASFPYLREPEGLADLWQSGLQALKKIPVNPSHKLLLKRSLGKEVLYEVRFTGFGNNTIRGLLSLPRRKKGVPAIVQFHDFNAPLLRSGSFTELGMAHLSIELRGHSSLELANRSSSGALEKNSAEQKVNYFEQQHPMEQFPQDQAATSWPFAAMLDAVRAVDFLRLQKEVNPSKIGVYGRGFGAAMAVIAAAHRKNSVSAVALELPSFLWIPGWIKESTSPLAADLRKIKEIQKTSIQRKVTRAIEFVDPFFFSEELEQPLFMSLDMESQESPPLPAFSFFHHVQSEKEMHLFMEKNQDPNHKKKTLRAREFFKQNLK